VDFLLVFIEIGRLTLLLGRAGGAQQRGITARCFRRFVVIPWWLFRHCGYEVGIVFGNGCWARGPGLGLFATNPRALAVILLITILATLGVRSGGCRARWRKRSARREHRGLLPNPSAAGGATRTDMCSTRSPTCAC